MKVSLVIPSYNEEYYIGQCLTSAFKQSDLPDEVIVVNNNSTDKTVEIAKKFPVKIVNEPVQGMIPARNRGFDEARGEIIARCDADALLPTDWVAKIKENFKKGGIDALSGPIIFYDLFEKIATPLPSIVHLEFLKLISKGKRYLIGPNMALTEKIWQEVKNKVNLDDSEVHEDLDLSININKIGGKIGYDPDLIVSISGRRIKKNPESFFIEYPIRLIKTLLQ